MSAPSATPRSVHTSPAAQSSSPKVVRVHAMPTVSEPLGATHWWVSLPIIIVSMTMVQRVSGACGQFCLTRSQSAGLTAARSGAAMAMSGTAASMPA